MTFGSTTQHFGEKVEGEAPRAYHLPLLKETIMIKHGLSKLRPLAKQQTLEGCFWKSNDLFAKP